MAIDQVQLRFDSGGLWLLNLFIGLIMFGVALDVRPADFGRMCASRSRPWSDCSRNSACFLA